MAAATSDEEGFERLGFGVANGGHRKEEQEC